VQKGHLRTGGQEEKAECLAPRSSGTSRQFEIPGTLYKEGLGEAKKNNMVKKVFGGGKNGPNETQREVWEKCTGTTQKQEWG